MISEKLIQALVQWLPSGIGIAITLNALTEQRFGAAVFFAFLTGCSSLWIKFSISFMKHAEAEAELRGEKICSAHSLHDG
jgi:hypothetical protein